MRPFSPELLAVLGSGVLALVGSAVRLGIWLERMDNVKHGLTVEVRNLRDNHNQRFDSLEVRLASIDRQLASNDDRHAKSERFQGGVESTLLAHEQRIESVERSVLTGAAPRVAA